MNPETNKPADAVGLIAAAAHSYLAEHPDALQLVAFAWSDVVAPGMLVLHVNPAPKRYCLATILGYTLALDFQELPGQA